MTESRRWSLSLMDGLLVLMVVVWGLNYSVMKRAFQEIPPVVANAWRFILASIVFFVAIQWARRRAHRVPLAWQPVLYTVHPPTTRERLQLVFLGLVGHFCYQFLWMGSVARTSVANAALIIGASPILVATASAALGRERLGRQYWMGVVASALGIYLVVGSGASLGGSSLRGDLMMVAAAACWSVYTLGAAPLMTRHSPLYVTGTTVMIGTVPYLMVALPTLLSLHSPPRWSLLALLAASGVLGINVSYLIWYAAVRRIGAARTSMYSNLVPITAMVFAVIWLREPVSILKLAGTAAVLVGVVLTRLGRVVPAVPIED